MKYLTHGGKKRAPTRWRCRFARTRREAASSTSLIAPRLPWRLRQPRDVDGDPPRLVLRQHLRLPRLGLVVAGVEVGKRLPVGVADDVAAGDRLGAPGWGNRRDGSAIAALYGLKSLIETFIGAVSKARNTTQLSQDSGAMD